MGRVNRMAQELLAVPHLHLTLTIAKEMRPFFDSDRSLLHPLQRPVVRNLSLAAKLKQIALSCQSKRLVGERFSVNYQQMRLAP